MKKSTTYINDKNKASERDKNLGIDKIKTTNVNILLNRVRLNQKKTLKKRIIFSFTLVILISCLVVYFTI